MGKLNDLYNLEDSTKSVNDFRRDFLVSDGVSPGTLNDMEFSKLRALGYTGTLDDMWAAYVAAQGGGEKLVDVFSDTFWAGSSTPSATAFDGGTFSTLTGVAGWGMVLRNSAYSGNAIQVSQISNRANKTNVGFDSNGWVTDVEPYGTSDTHIYQVYDQWGSDNMVENDAADVISMGYGNKLYTRVIQGGRNGHLQSTYQGNNASAEWSSGRLVFALGLRRPINLIGSLDVIFGAEAISGSYMGVGAWDDAGDLHSRIEGGGPNDWTGTNWSTNAADVVDQFVSVIIDISQEDGNAYYYVDNTLVLTDAFTNPFDIAGTNNLHIFGGLLGSEGAFEITELHVFEATSGMSTDDRSTLHTLLREPYMSAEDQAADPLAQNANTVFQMDWFGIDNGQDTLDKSPSEHTVIWTGNARIETGARIFSPTVLYLDGFGDNVSVADHADFDLASNDFTLEAWINPNAITGDRTIMSKDDTTTGWRFTCTASGDGKIRFDNRGGVSLVSTTAINTTDWNHVAITREGNVFRLFVNGTEEDTDTVSGAMGNPTTAFLVGCINTAASPQNQYEGDMGPVRVINGEAVYTADFTPPIGPWARYLG